METKNLQNSIVYTFECENDTWADENRTPLTGKRVCLSGRFVKNNEVLKKYIKRAGGFIDSQVLFTTDYFIKGNIYSSDAYKKALSFIIAESKIKIINDVDFYSLLRQCGIKSI